MNKLISLIALTQLTEACVTEASSEADSGSFRATDVDGASNAAAFSSPKKDREMAGEMKVDSYKLFAPRS